MAVGECRIYSQFPRMGSGPAIRTKKDQPVYGFFLYFCVHSDEYALENTNNSYYRFFMAAHFKSRLSRIYVKFSYL